MRGKLWGIIESARPYMVAYLVPALIASLRHGEVGPPLITTCFWICTWGMLYFLAANGISCSVLSGSSWTSLILTFTNGAKVAAPFVPWAAVLAAIPFFAALEICGWSIALGCAYVIMFLGVLMAFLFSQTESLLEEAERHINNRDRVRQVLLEPKRPRRAVAADWM